MHRWQKPSLMSGVRYDLETMRAHLATVLRVYADEFAALPSYQDACRKGFGPGYTRIDALILYCKLRAQKPTRYLEVGSGLSTYYASLAAKANAMDGFPMRITCIEPHPFTALSTIPCINILKKQVQDEDLGTFAELEANDVLFIDSSHVVRLDGDVPFLFLEVLPSLHPGVLIHVHDIPFPYHHPYPPDYWIYGQRWPMWWNESMLLQALLCGSTLFDVELSLPLIRHHDERTLSSMIFDYKTVAEDANTFSSLWLRRLDT